MSDGENPNTYDGENLSFPMMSSKLKRNDYIVIKGRPCKIVDMSTSKTGKHGHEKIHLVGIDLFTCSKLEHIALSTHDSDIPIVHQEEYQLDGVDHERGCLVLTSMSGDTKNDVPVPDGDLGQTIMEYLNRGEGGIVTILSAMNEEACVQIRSRK